MKQYGLGSRSGFGADETTGLETRRLRSPIHSCHSAAPEGSCIGRQIVSEVAEDQETISISAASGEALILFVR